MAYRKSYYQQRVEEQGRIREAVRKQIEAQRAESEQPAPVTPPEPAAPAVDPEPEVDVPTSEWTKVQIRAWLDEHEIDWSPSMNKTQLLDLVN